MGRADDAFPIYIAAAGGQNESHNSLHWLSSELTLLLLVQVML